MNILNEVMPSLDQSHLRDAASFTSVMIMWKP